MARTLPVYTAEVAWSDTPTGAITIGTSTVGSADQIGGLFSHFTFASIKADLKDAVIQRGRTGQDGAMSEGRMTLRLKDLAGTYNPENAGSALAPNVIPLRPVRLRATHNAITYGLFFGFITRIEHDPHPEAQETVIEAADVFHWLGVFRPVLSLGQTTVGAAIGAILGACGLTDPAYLALDTGHTVPFVVADGSRTALQLIGELLETDMGILFVDGAGVVTYHDATRRYAPTAVDDTLTGTLIGGARPATDIALVRNGWHAIRMGPDGSSVGPLLYAFDFEGRAPGAYGPRDAPTISSPYFENDSRVQNLLNFKVLLYKDPTDPVRGVRLSNRDDTLIVKQLARDVGDKVALSETLGGTSLTGFVEGVRHHIWEGGMFHEADLTVSKRRFDFVTIGSSTVGGAHVIGY